MVTTVLNFSNANDLLNHICSWNNDYNGYVFRGQSSDTYQLIPSIFRENARYIADSEYPRNGTNSHFEYSQIQSEFKLLREFFKLADQNGLKVPISENIRRFLISKHDYNFAKSTDQDSLWIPDDLLDVAALAQHYGIPTRLLDWSYDPFISAYFAASSVNDSEGNLAIWCFNAEWVSTSMMRMSNSPLRIITPPNSDNQNLSAQRGLFTHISTPINFNDTSNVDKEVDRRPLDAQLDELLPMRMQNRDKTLIKLILPRSEAKDLLYKLMQHNYGDARIYPGYNGVADQVMRKFKK
ncbi:FRG domain-containing protein [Rosenbergiella australiborealis]|uniref:FRG domain-containing protein n=1 Tax=Rosenbergiella australiborealis TaxID=1544696 RepID=A0ABS5T347_9GAMM|nr:FRG domain-containing protein [Rosenbergiella australiborealis]MBT0726784.1 FRG domain-containing protein [Rosenbergiella australiborealis]